MLKIVNIDLSFTGNKVFENFSLQIDRGTKVLLDAPSGKGKTSLLKIIMGFVTPDSGEVYIDKQLLTTSNIKELRSRIAYLPQDIAFPKMKVSEFIKLVLTYESNRHIKYNEEQVREMLGELKLPLSILKQDTLSISGGEKQRIGILIMQLLNREIFLLDEITSALNSELKVFIANYFLQMKQTVVIVSHDDIWQESAIRKVSW